MTATATPRLRIGDRRYDWRHDGMAETPDGGYLLATNERLAAPQLLAALKRVLREADDDGITQDGVDEALAAITQAEGRDA